MVKQKINKKSVNIQKMMHIFVLQRSTHILQQLFSCSKAKLKALFSSLLNVFQTFLLQANPFWVDLSYFLFISIIGYAALQIFTTEKSKHRSTNFDMFFMSVSASTVSSMSTVEMEILSNVQLVILGFLMFSGGEVFSSMVQLQLLKLKSTQNTPKESNLEIFKIEPHTSIPQNFLEQLAISKGCNTLTDVENPISIEEIVNKTPQNQELRCRALSLLLYLVVCYLLVCHLVGTVLVYIYVTVVQSAKHILMQKGINLMAFSTFLTASTFANGGFVPTNENMMVFNKNSGLLLMLIPQVLIGSTLYPLCLRLAVWGLERITKREEFQYVLRNPREIGYGHLFSGLTTKCLAFSAMGFWILQLVCFCSMEWHSESTSGLSNYEKFVGSLFQVINSRHAGESAFDLSLFSPAMLLLFVVMMYLPPYCCIQPFNEEKNIAKIMEGKMERKKKATTAYLLLSPLCYLIVFLLLICITEREKMRDDPLNFSVFNIVLEVISAYGNVGFSMGYKCEKQINPSSLCRNTSYGFVGRWSKEGKFIIIIVMICGKLKKFSINGGKAWRNL